MIVAGPARDLEMAEWLADRVKHFEVNASPFVALGWQRREKLVAVTVYDNFTHINIDAHIALERGGLCAAYLGEIFRYPFVLLSVKRITAKVAASNIRSAKFVDGLGFKYEGTVRQALPGGEDLLIFGMLKSECRWLGVGIYGREHNSRSADAATAGGRRTAGGLTH